MQAKGVCQVLIKVFSRLGILKEIQTDCGTSFMSTSVKTLCEVLGVTHLLNSVYHPQTNSLVERMNQTLKRLLHKYVGSCPTQWDTYLDPLLFALRETPQTSTRLLPFMVVYGRQP